MSVEPTRVPIVDEGTLARLRALSARVADPGEDLLGDLVSLLARDGRTLVDAIRAAIEEGNADARQRHAHTLKGAAANLGATRLAALARALEHGPAGAHDVAILDAALDEAVAALQERLA